MSNFLFSWYSMFPVAIAIISLLIAKFGELESVLRQASIVGALAGFAGTFFGMYLQGFAKGIYPSSGSIFVTSLIMAVVCSVITNTLFNTNIFKNVNMKEVTSFEWLIIATMALVALLELNKSTNAE